MDEKILNIYKNIPALQKVGSEEQFLEAMKSEKGRRAIYDNVAEVRDVGTFEQFSEFGKSTPKEDFENEAKTVGVGETFVKSAKGLISSMAKVPEFLADDLPRGILKGVGFDPDAVDKALDTPSINPQLTAAKAIANIGRSLEESEIVKEIDSQNEDLQKRISEQYDGKSSVDLFEEGEIGKGAGRLMYDVAQGLPSLLVAIGAGPAGFAALSTSTAAETTESLKKEGVDDSTAAVAGVGAGLAEFIFEKNIFRQICKTS